MALVTCSECGNRISDQAEKCPFCGKPQNERVVTVQLTSKRWKLVKLISVIGIIFGGGVFMSNFNKYGFQSAWTGLGFCILFVSIVARFIGKIGAWWTNR